MDGVRQFAPFNETFSRKDYFFLLIPYSPDEMLLNPL